MTTNNEKFPLLDVKNWHKWPRLILASDVLLFYEVERKGRERTQRIREQLAGEGGFDVL